MRRLRDILRGDFRTLGFWHFQITGWLLLYAGDIVLIIARGRSLSEGLTEACETPVAFLLSLGLRRIYTRLDYKRLSVVSLIAYLTVWSLIITGVWYVLIAAIWYFAMSARIGLAMFDPGYVFRWLNYLAPLWFSWSALYFGIKYWRDWIDEKERARIATALAQKAQLQMLRYQLNPHFLFNALNSLRALIDEDKRLAKGMITELSEFLRYSLVSRRATSVPLRDELDAIRHYLAIEKKRFEDKLQVSFAVDPKAEDVPVLSFLIHPLVENAVKYGMKTSPMPLRLKLEASVNDGGLTVDVWNSGRWLDESDAAKPGAGTGTGLENTRARLANAYPGRHHVDVITEGNAVHVRLRIDEILTEA